jgi:hypothetical protein
MTLLVGLCFHVAANGVRSKFKLVGTHAAVTQTHLRWMLLHDGTSDFSRSASAAYGTVNFNSLCSFASRSMANLALEFPAHARLAICEPNPAYLSSCR